MELAPDDRISLRIDALAGGGDGVGRHRGVAVFVPLAAPGDLVRVRVSRVHKRHANAEILELLEPGEGRRAPPCPYFGRCGGCDWMHLSDAAQQRARLAIVRDALERIGHLVDLPELRYVPSPASLGYRSRARLAFGAGRVGFRERSSHEIVDVERCAVLDAATQCELDRVRAEQPRGQGEQSIRGYGERIEISGREFHVGPGAFFQTNRLLWEAWLACVLDACGAGSLAVELYAGVGFYTAGLCARFSRVIAVERGRHARDARRNAKAQVIRAAAEDWAPAELCGLAPDLVLLNPPRTGCHRMVSDALKDSNAARVVYVSCEPATLARDIACVAGAYTVTSITCIDALPHTHHVEVVAALQRIREKGIDSPDPA